ncbi:MAG: DUF3089 domain-containing protein [Sphingomonadales bacterium]|nr:DUF3089 domain-containing protein [Sphingomonadales bacterium]MDE2568562.1 DUF3089 domain-containing protein [Sphingomonadales bacterium]
MARKFLYFVAVLVVMTLASLLALRIWSMQLAEFAFVPRVPFEQLPPLSARAYDDPRMWLARPGMGSGDPAQWLPSGISQGSAPRSRAAVFFINPTSYFARRTWNAPLDDHTANQRADLFARGMASAFNRSADLWAPRYREATFGVFLTTRPEARQALDLAYGDLENAFAHFIASLPADQPVILAGHSQGALQLMRLLKDHVAGTPLATRVIAAYVVGWPVSTQHDLPVLGLPACTAPDQAGCVMSWESFAEPADPSMVLDAYAKSIGLDGKPRAGSPILCTNPLTGTAGGFAPASANLGTLVPNEALSGGTLAKGIVPARCAPSGMLLIGPPPDMGVYLMPGNNYHLYDIPLFWANVRADTERREAAWWKAH